MISFSAFIDMFFLRLHEAGIVYCVMRNHSGLPQILSGRDVDVLVDRKDRDAILACLRSFDDVEIVGVLNRANMTAVYLYGVDLGDGSHSLEIDLDFKLSWKGLSFLRESDVLARRQSLSHCEHIYVPLPCDEGISLCLSTLFRYGYVPKKYEKKIRDLLLVDQVQSLKVLCTIFSEEVARRFLAIAIVEPSGLLPLRKSFMRPFLKAHFFRSPFASSCVLGKHFFAEIRIVLSEAHSYRIAILGPDGAGKSSVFDRVLPCFRGAAGDVLVTHLKPTVFFRKRLETRGVVTDPHGKPPRSALTSHLKIFLWIAETWIARFKSSPKNFSLLFFDRYYPDLLVDPKRYRYSGSRLFVRLMSVFSRPPHLLLVLVGDAKTINDRKREVPFEDTRDQIDRYRALVESMPQAYAIEADRPLDVVVDEAVTHIVNGMAEHARGCR